MTDTAWAIIHTIVATVAFAVGFCIAAEIREWRDNTLSIEREIPFSLFLEAYGKAPDRWTLLPYYVRYGADDVRFENYADYRKYQKWREKRKRDEEEERKRSMNERLFREIRSDLMPTPPTTGTSVIDPAKRKYDEYSVLQHGAGTVQRDCKPILTSAIVQAEDGKIIIPPEEAGEPVSRYGDGKIYGYVQKLLPDDGNDDGKAYSINPRTGEVEGYPAIDRAVYQVYFWTSGCGKKKAEILQEMARIKKGESQKRNDEIVRIDGAKLIPHPAEFCGDCPWASGNYPDVVICMNDHHAHLSSERCKYRKQAVLKPTKTVREGECKKCRYFQKHDKPPFGYCVRNDEITDEAYVKLCFEPIPPIAHKRPEPLGTVATH